MSRALNMAKLCAEGHLFVDDRATSIRELLEASTGAVWRQKTAQLWVFKVQRCPFFLVPSFSHVCPSQQIQTQKNKINSYEQPSEQNAS